MIIWGAIWGAIFGFVFYHQNSEWGAVLGAALGALAGRTFRDAMRKEVAEQIVLLGQRLIAAPHQPQVAPEPAKPRQQEPAESEPEPESWGSVYTQPMRLDIAPARKPMIQPLRTELQTPESEPDPDIVYRTFAAARDWLLGGNTIVRMGVLVLFVGLAFLAKYAVDNAFLPPEVRLSGIGLAGIALLAFGWKLRERQPGRQAYALTLQGAGVTVLYLTVFAAFGLYQLLPAGVAFGVLGVVCALSTAIALMQNAMPMAFIGFAGAFAAPILVSTGQGDQVGLFSYYLLLSIGIAVIAWLRAWRSLNLLGFFATFGIATLWGTLRYQPAQFESTEPFLLAFFAIYLATSLMYATRHGLQARKAVDATLIFGNPLVAFGLQAALVHDIEYATAFSALALGALYLGLGWWAVKRRDRQAGGAVNQVSQVNQVNQVSQWLAECFLALGLGFVTLAVPLALDARWTTGVWAAEGAAFYWMGQRQQRWLPRLSGLVLQFLAALSYLNAMNYEPGTAWPLANPMFMGAALLAASALAIAQWARSAPQWAESNWARQFSSIESKLSPVLFWVGFLWWQFALMQEIRRTTVTPNALWEPVLSHSLQTHFEMLAWLVSAWVAHRFALPERQKPWSVAGTPAWFSIAIMLLVAVQGVVELSHVFQAWGWLVWPVALLLHFVTLRRLDALAPHRWWSWVHSAGIWLLVLLVGSLLVWGVREAYLQGTAWASVIVLLASVLVLLALSHSALYNVVSRVRNSWPLDRFVRAYLWRAALPVAVAVALGALIVAVHSSGNTQPLPYVPLLNPTDLTLALALGACTLWLKRIRENHTGLAITAAVLHVRWTLMLAAVAFVAVNTVWLRVAHHWAGVPWTVQGLYGSFVVQAGYSILWTLIALGLMLLAARREIRTIWMGGAGLLGVTVAKLFLVDLSNSGGSERIVAFIAVGVLMLVVGYVAPIPPSKAPLPDDSSKEPA